MEAKSIVEQIKQEPLNPALWKQLGKALEKEESWILYENGKWNETDVDSRWQSRTPFASPWWLHQGTTYAECVLTSGDVEKFWKELLSR